MNKEFLGINRFGLAYYFIHKAIKAIQIKNRKSIRIYPTLVTMK